MQQRTMTDPARQCRSPLAVGRSERSPTGWIGSAAAAPGQCPSGCLGTSQRQCPRLPWLPSSHVPSAMSLKPSEAAEAKHGPQALKLPKTNQQESGEMAVLQGIGQGHHEIMEYHQGPSKARARLLWLPSPHVPSAAPSRLCCSGC